MTLAQLQRATIAQITRYISIADNWKSVAMKQHPVYACSKQYQWNNINADTQISIIHSAGFSEYYDYRVLPQVCKQLNGDAVTPSFIKAHSATDISSGKIILESMKLQWVAPIERFYLIIPKQPSGSGYNRTNIACLQNIGYLEPIVLLCNSVYSCPDFSTMFTIPLSAFVTAYNMQGIVEARGIAPLELEDKLVPRSYTAKTISPAVTKPVNNDLIKLSTKELATVLKDRYVNKTLSTSDFEYIVLRALSNWADLNKICQIKGNKSIHGFLSNTYVTFTVSVNDNNPEIRIRCHTRNWVLSDWRTEIAPFCKFLLIRDSAVVLCARQQYRQDIAVPSFSWGYPSQVLKQTKLIELFEYATEFGYCEDHITGAQSFRTSDFNQVCPAEIMACMLPDLSTLVKMHGNSLTSSVRTYLSDIVFTTLVIARSDVNSHSLAWDEVKTKCTVAVVTSKQLECELDIKLQGTTSVIHCDFVIENWVTRARLKSLKVNDVIVDIHSPFNNLDDVAYAYKNDAQLRTLLAKDESLYFNSNGVLGSVIHAVSILQHDILCKRKEYGKASVILAKDMGTPTDKLYGLSSSSAFECGLYANCTLTFE